MILCRNFDIRDRRGGGNANREHSSSNTPIYWPFIYYFLSKTENSSSYQMAILSRRSVNTILLPNHRWDHFFFLNMQVIEYPISVLNKLQYSMLAIKYFSSSGFIYLLLIVPVLTKLSIIVNVVFSPFAVAP